MNNVPYIKIIIVLIAILFVPLIPNDTPIECTGASETCDGGVGYISVYTKYLSK